MRPPRPAQRSVAFYVELHGSSQWGCPHASATPSTAFRGLIGSHTCGPSGGGGMRPPHPVQRFVAP
eukprot:1736648-Pyramimonas_sp.AAC.1